MLQASGICKSYGKRRIIEQAEFFAGRGSCVGVVGANGCGKTTLLSILAGTRKADRGSVKIDGEEALGHPSVFARNVAYVPQENPLMEELTVRDNLLLWHRGNKKQMNEDLKRVSDTINQLSLKCYSIEGKYPKDIEYLKENYGLLLNDEDYQVIYYYEGDNLQPRIKVFKKEKNYEYCSYRDRICWACSRGNNGRIWS